jgi:hypothetical protein
VGLFDWLKRKDAGDSSSTTITVTTRDASEDLQDPEQREALEQAERLIHEILTGGAEQESAGSGEGKAGEGRAGAFVFAAPTQVIVAGQPVSADDPRALEAMSTAAAKLREHGLDELAAELEARAGAAPAAPPGTRPQALAAAGEDAQPLSAPADAADVTPSAADVTPSAADVTPSAADATDTASSAPADDLGAPPDAPAPPEPPAPPS